MDRRGMTGGLLLGLWLPALLVVGSLLLGVGVDGDGDGDAMGVVVLLPPPPLALAKAAWAA